MIVRISMHCIQDILSPREFYKLLKTAGVKLQPYRNGGFFQPLWDWLEWEGRPEVLLVPPWKFYFDEAERYLVIEQPDEA